MSRPKPGEPRGHNRIANEAEARIMACFRDDLEKMADSLAPHVRRAVLDALHTVYNEGLVHGRGACRSVAAAYVGALRAHLALPVPGVDEVLAQLGQDDKGVARAEVLEICQRLGLPLIELDEES